MVSYSVVAPAVSRPDSGQRPEPGSLRSDARRCRRSHARRWPERTKDDIVYDLGCGDGRIPIAAAKTYGARGVGIDIDPKRIDESRANAKAAGVEHLVEFRLGTSLAADVSPATVVTLYMLGSGNAALRPLLTRQLRPGARIVSHAFSMGPTWPADKVDHFTSARGDEVTLYFWKADGKIRP